jgi:hypothetical protein
MFGQGSAVGETALSDHDPTKEAGFSSREASVPNRSLVAIATIWLIFAASILGWHLYTETAVAPAYGQMQAFADDTINFWTGPRLALSGRIGEVYDGPALHRFQEATAGRPLGQYEYSYPPVTILMTLPLGLLPYLPACGVSGPAIPLRPRCSSRSRFRR